MEERGGGATVAGSAVAPGVAGDTRAPRRVGILPAQIPGRQNPLAGLDNVRIQRCRRDAVSGYPLRPRRHANLVGLRGIFAQDRADSVGAVVERRPAYIHWEGTVADGRPPVVVVVKVAA